MDQKNPNNAPPSPNDISFQIMPHGVPGAPPPPPQRPSSPTPPSGVNHSLPVEPESGGRSKIAYIIIGIAVLAALGALAYFLLGAKITSEPDNQPQGKLPKAWMNLYFNSETCNTPSTCGDDADPDDDGLKNFDEFKEGGNPINPDTDSDGLADGDEVNVYLTDPALKYTDRRELVSQNDWTDGFQIKNGFDPIDPGQKLNEERLRKISEATTEFGLHEPTTTTLKPTAQ